MAWSDQEPYSEQSCGSSFESGPDVFDLKTYAGVLSVYLFFSCSGPLREIVMGWEGRNIPWVAIPLNIVYEVLQEWEQTVDIPQDTLKITFFTEVIGLKL